VSDGLDFNDPAAVIDVLDGAADAMCLAACRVKSIVRIPPANDGRLVATGDLHDNPFNLRKIIALAKLDASPNHHVVLHEMIHGERLINGMDFSYRMLARVAELVVQYPEQVHPLLANHEIAQMIGRGVSKGAGNSVHLFNDALEFVFGDACQEVAEAINRFIRAMPLALITDDPHDAGGGLLCAHSLPAESSMKHFDRDVFARELTEADFRPPHGSAYLMTWGRNYTEEQIEDLADYWGVELFCLGHEHAETGILTRGRRVVILNSDHEQARVLPIDLIAPPTAEEAPMYAVPLGAVSAEE